MADFQNGLISRIFSDFSRGFFHRTTLNHSRMGFDMFFGLISPIFSVFLAVFSTELF